MRYFELNTMCIEEECGEAARTRSLCLSHYHRRRQRGEPLPPLMRNKHTLSNISHIDMTATCATCGPVPVFRRPDGGLGCGSHKNVGKQEYMARSTARLSRPHSEGRRRDGLTVEQIRNQVRERSGGSCEICGSVDRLHVDHDHTCCRPSSLCLDCVRGVLCGRCNTALGGLDDDVEKLLAAVEYLQAHSLEVS